MKMPLVFKPPAFCKALITDRSPGREKAPTSIFQSCEPSLKLTNAYDQQFKNTDEPRTSIEAEILTATRPVLGVVWNMAKRLNWICFEQQNIIAYQLN
jgi:hypothetical protein